MTCTSPCTISGLDPGTEYQDLVPSLVAEYLVGMKNGPGVLLLCGGGAGS